MSRGDAAKSVRADSFWNAQIHMRRNSSGGFGQRDREVRLQIQILMQMQKTDTVHSSDRMVLCNGWIRSCFGTRGKPDPQMQTRVRRWREAEARGDAFGREAAWLQQKYRADRLGETGLIGTGKNSADCFVIAGEEFTFIGLHPGGICNQMVGILIPEPAVILRRGIGRGAGNDAGKDQHH